MFRKNLINLFLLVSLILSFQAIGQDATHPGQIQINENFNFVRSGFTGEQAYSTVTYVEKFWRLAGNSGFDSAIYHIAGVLEDAGYAYEENEENQSSLTYRIEKRVMDHLTWEPYNGSLEIETAEGFRKILDFGSNRNMIAVNSWPTPDTGIVAELVYIKPDLTEREKESLDLKGKILFTETYPWRMMDLIRDRGAIGIISYSNPDYVKPEVNRSSIQFRNIPLDTIRKPWAITLSFSARKAILRELSQGPLKVRVNIKTRLFRSEELTLIADIKGQRYPEERLVYSAHVQEPGANDNASGAGVQTEMAVVLSELITTGNFKPDRSVTFLFGDEIVSTRRYIRENNERSSGIKWGISLDMVGENTAITGGSFLIEKMPDPGAIWTRGQERHTEWGGARLKKEDLEPHYFNDFMIDIFSRQGEYANWTVKTNPFEGGSDHIPFLQADIPGILLWHFTDVFYHTDGDRLDKVSKETLINVGTGALVAGMTLVNGNSDLADYVLENLHTAASSRLVSEFNSSKASIADGGNKNEETDIIQTWKEYYIASMGTTGHLMPRGQVPKQLRDKIKTFQKRIDLLGDKLVRRLDY